MLWTLVAVCWVTSGAFAQNADDQNVQSITASGTARSFAGDPGTGNPIFELGTGRETSTVTITLTGGNCPTIQRSSPVDVALVIDVSSSMTYPSGNLSRIEAVQVAARQFLTRFNLTPNDPDDRDQIAIVTFSNSAVTQRPFSSNLNDLRSTIDGLQANGGTNIAAGLVEATRILRGATDVAGGPRSGSIPVIILLTDAEVDSGLFGISGMDKQAVIDAANRARLNLPGLKIVTIAFGESADFRLMQQIANAPANENAFRAISPDELVASYDRIATLVQPKIAGRDLSMVYTVNSAFELVPDSISPPPADVTNNTITWTGLGNLNTGQALDVQFDVRSRQSGITVVGTAAYAYKACESSTERTDDYSGPRINTLIPTPTPTPSNTPTPTFTPTPTNTPTAAPPAWTQQQDTLVDTTTAGVTGALCDQGIYDWLPLIVALIILAIAIIWFILGIRSMRKNGTLGSRNVACKLLQSLVLAYLAFLVYMFLQPLVGRFCPISESVYFWRMDGNTRGIYITNENLRGDTPAQVASLNEVGCVGCHSVSRDTDRIAAIHGPIPGNLIVTDLGGNDENAPMLDAVYTSWSPDGTRLAATTNGADLFVLGDLGTGEPRQILNATDANFGAVMPTWSADGTSIAYVRVPRREINIGLYIYNTSEIYVVPADDSAPAQPLVTQALSPGLSYYPAFSPDGHWLAFTHAANGNNNSNPNADIWLMNLQSQEVFPIASNSGVSDSWATWNRDGTKLAFNTKRYDPNYDIVLVNVQADGTTSPSAPLKLHGASQSSVFEHLPYWGEPIERVPLLDLWKPLLPLLLPFLLMLLMMIACLMFKPKDPPPPQPPPAPPSAPPNLEPMELRSWEGIQKLWTPQPALVIGMGAAGWQVLTHLKKTLSDAGLGTPSDKVRLLGIIAGEQEKLIGDDFAGIALTRTPTKAGEKREIIEWRDPLQQLINEAPDDQAAQQWVDQRYLSNFTQSVSNPRLGFQGIRLLGRLALLNNLRGNRSGTGVSIWDMLREAARDVKDQDVLTVILVTDLADDVGSGAALDVSYLAKRLSSESALGINTVRVIAHAVTARVSGVRAVDEAIRSLNTAAALREVARFQLSGAAPFPMSYAKNPQQTTPFDGMSSGVLFDELYIHDAPGMDSPQLSNYPIVADSIALWLDEAAAKGDLAGWRDRTLSTMRDAQIQDQHVMLGAAGLYQYRLPFSDLLEAITTMFAYDVIQRLLMGNSSELPQFGDKPETFVTESFSAAGRTLRTPRELAQAFLLEMLGGTKWAEQWRRMWQSLPAQDTAPLKQALDKLRIDDERDNQIFKDWLYTITLVLLNGRKGSDETDDAVEKRGAKLGLVLEFLKHVGDEHSGLLTLYANRIDQVSPEHEAANRLRAFAKVARELRAHLLTTAEGLGMEGRPNSLHRRLDNRKKQSASLSKNLLALRSRSYITEARDANGKLRPLTDIWYAQYLVHHLREAIQQMHWKVNADGEIVLSLRIAGKTNEPQRSEDIVFAPENIEAFEAALIEIGQYFARSVRENESLAKILAASILHMDNLQSTVRTLKEQSIPRIRTTDTEAPRKTTSYIISSSESLGEVGQRLIAELRRGIRDQDSVKELRTDDPFTLTLVQMVDGIPKEAVNTLVSDEIRYADEVYALQRARPASVFDAEVHAVEYERRLVEIDQAPHIFNPIVVTALANRTQTEVYLLAAAALMQTEGTFGELRVERNRVVFNSRETGELVLLEIGKAPLFSPFIDGLLEFGRRVDEETAQAILRRYRNDDDLLEAIDAWELEVTSGDLWREQFAARDRSNVPLPDPALDDLIAITRLLIRAVLQ